MDNPALTTTPPLSPIQLYMTFTIIWLRQQQHDYYAYRTPLPTKASYDYVVVGAGSAGAIVACRLAQNGKDVLLLEAGGAQDAYSHDHPGVYVQTLLLDGPAFWPYYLVPQGRVGKGSPLFQGSLKGRVLGGSSTVNFMMYNRYTILYISFCSGLILNIWTPIILI